MYYKIFGKTNKKVSAMGMGGNFSLDLCSTEEGREKCAQVVVKAIEKGINYFDTAPTYCNGHSEEIFGQAFKQIKGKEFYISDKASVAMCPKADDVRINIEKSLQKLNADKITFFSVWGLLDYTQYLKAIEKGGLYDGLLIAKK